MRWAAGLAQLQLNIKYRSGKANRNAAVSRKLHHEQEPHSARFEEIHWSMESGDIFGIHLGTRLSEVYDLVESESSSRQARSEELQTSASPASGCYKHVSRYVCARDTEKARCRRQGESCEVLLQHKKSANSRNMSRGQYDEYGNNAGD